MLSEIKARWLEASSPPWNRGSSWRDILAASVLIADIPPSSLSKKQQQKNAAAMRSAASDIAWLITEVERLTAERSSFYDVFWEDIY